MTDPETVTLSSSLQKSLQSVTFQARDGAARALAARYAELLDSASWVAAQAAEALEGQDLTLATRRQLVALAEVVNAYTVAENLGPKYLAALAALGLTPLSRATNAKGGTSDVIDPAAEAYGRLLSDVPGLPPEGLRGDGTSPVDPTAEGTDT